MTPHETVDIRKRTNSDKYSKRKGGDWGRSTHITLKFDIAHPDLAQQIFRPGVTGIVFDQFGIHLAIQAEEMLHPGGP